MQLKYINEKNGKNNFFVLFISLWKEIPLNMFIQPFYFKNEYSII